MNSLLRKKAIWPFFLVLFCLLSCSKKATHWELVTIKARCPCVTYAKAYLPACNQFSGFETEFLCDGCTIRLYLNALSLQFPWNGEDMNHVDVTIAIQDQLYVFTADRFEGGQRLMLPDDAQQLVIEMLLNGYPVDICVGRYHETLVTDSFTKIYNAGMK